MERQRTRRPQLGGLEPTVEVRSSLGPARITADPFEHHRRAKHFPLSNQQKSTLKRDVRDVLKVSAARDAIVQLSMDT